MDRGDFTIRGSCDKGDTMRNAIRAGTRVAVVLVTMAGVPGARAEDPTPAGAPGQTPTGQRIEEPSAQVFEPGAASVEPGQSIDEDAGSRAHQAWVDSIHDSP
jgi:hypothetical protein